MKHLVLVTTLALVIAACAPAPSTEPSNLHEQTGIVGGEKVSGSSLVGRSTVGIYEPNIGYICTGTLIAKNLILTAGHCVDPKATKLAVIFAPEMRTAPAESIRMVDKAVVHPQYSQEVKAKDMYDIALLRIQGEAPAGFEVAPMLFTQGFLRDHRSTIVAGYGLNWTVGIKSGAGTLRTTSLQIDEVNFSSTEVLLGQSVRRGICSGDSGGPAYIELNGKLHVWGVASRGDSLPGFFIPKCMLFSVFTRVDAHQEWIHNTMTDLLK